MPKEYIEHSDRSDSIKLILHSHPNFFIRQGNILILIILATMIGCIIYLPYSEEIPVKVVFSTTKTSSNLVGKFQIPYAPASTLQRGKNILLSSNSVYLYSTIIGTRDTITINYTRKIVYFRVNNLKKNIHSSNLNSKLPLQYMISIHYSRFINKFTSSK